MTLPWGQEMHPLGRDSPLKLLFALKGLTQCLPLELQKLFSERMASA